MTAYSEMLPELQAEEQLAAIEAASVPHMTDQARRQILSRIHAAIPTRAKPATPGDLATAGIRVKHVPKKVTT